MVSQRPFLGTSNLDVDTSNKRSSLTSESAVNADVAEADVVLEFFSGKHGKWIQVDIIDRDDSGSVQVSAKPGVWLSAKDCQRKLRARVQVDDPTIGSTIRSVDSFLPSKEKTGAKACSMNAPATTTPLADHWRRSSVVAATAGNTAFGDKSAMQSVNAPKAASVKQSMISGSRIATTSVKENQKGESLRAKVSKSMAQKPDMKQTDVSDSRNSCDTTTRDATQEPSPKARAVPLPATAGPPKSLHPATGPLHGTIRQSTGPLPSGSCFSCPRCGTSDLPTFESAVHHCPGPDQDDKAAKSDKSATPSTAENTSPTITHVPPGFQAGRQRNGLRFIRSTVPVAIQKAQDDLEEVAELSPVEGLWSVPTAPVSQGATPASDGCQPSPLESGGETDSTRSSEGRGTAPQQQHRHPSPQRRPSPQLDRSAAPRASLTAPRPQPSPQGSANPAAPQAASFTAARTQPLPARTPSPAAPDASFTAARTQPLPARTPSPPAPQASFTGALQPPAVGEAIAYNIRGEPIISRSVSSDTGAGVTIVVNEDGTKCTFGKNTLASLMSSDSDDAWSWIGSLSILETRGLVHEIGQVLLSTSQIYQFHLDRLKAVSERCHYEFFGLTEEATDVEVDRAYKKLAKQMHPDKNGGTENAKEAFQHMKEKYEALKERRANQDGDGPKRKTSKCSKSSDDESEEKGDDEAEPKEEKRKEAYDEDDEDEAPTKKESGQISYDPTDQGSLATTAVEMLQRLKAIEGSMSTVMSQLRQNGL
jgi:hypothetical protein